MTGVSYVNDSAVEKLCAVEKGHASLLDFARNDQRAAHFTTLNINFNYYN